MHAHTVRQSLHITRRSVVALAVAILMAASLSLATAETADAGHVTCGQVITTDTTLDSDVGPCPGDGIIVGQDAITLDLNGHEVFGLETEGQANDGVGVRLAGRDGVHVKDGTVRDFAAGVAIVNGSTNNTVTGVVARDNIGSGLSDFGDGIAISDSHDNLIQGNVADHNGPYDGIGVFGASTGNTIDDNKVVNNNVPSSLTVNQDDGIRLEPGTSNNTVTNNTVKNNGLDGIAVFADSTSNTLQGNDVRANGYHDKVHRKGDGVRVFDRASNTTIDTTNEVFDNAANGIRVDSENNEIRDNETGENGEAATAQEEVGPLTVTVDVRVRFQLAGEELQEPAPAFDLHDSNTDSEGNPSCDNNVWSGNTFDTAFPDCTTN